MLDTLMRRISCSARLGLGVTLVVAAVVVAPAGALGAEGLALDTADEKVVDAFDNPNPHFEMDCTDCHEGKPSFKTDTAETVKFVNGEEGNVALCYGCHDESDNIHPINVDPAAGSPPVNVPADLPLGRIGNDAGKVVCSTCHFIHAKTAGLKLLRGFPESSAEEDLKKAKFGDRRDMCRACHGADLEKKTPHKGIEGDEKTCAFCHATKPEKGQTVEFSKGLVELCDFCHAATKGAHYLLVNPFADPNLKDEIASSGVPLLGGAYTCVSCHDPHGGTDEPAYLRPNFIKLAVKSGRIRPHFQRSLCETCHTVRPKVPKGQPGAQPLSEIPLLSDDPNALCNRCHESGLSKANAHPLVKVEGSYAEKVPADWPLHNGGLTCLTCHTAGDVIVQDPNNPNFLRGAPYESRNDVCWVCHDQEEFAELDPHQDIQSGEGCEFCHATKPDMNKSIDLQEMKMKGDIIILCIRCHEAYPHPANADHTGVPNPERLEELSIVLPTEFPLDARGRMTCATCHNPHAGGDQRGVVVGMEICNLCHIKF